METQVLEIETNLLRKELSSKIFLISLTNKDMELTTYKIAKILYGKNVYTALPGIIRETKKLIKINIFNTREIITRENRRAKVLKPNIDRFVDLFIEYYNLNFSEEEKQKFKEWFKKIDWKFLSPPNNNWQNYELFGNVFEIIGFILKLLSKIYISMGNGTSTKNEVKKEIIKNPSKKLYESQEKQTNSSSLNTTISTILLHVSELPNSILEKLASISIPKMDMFEHFLLYSLLNERRL